jgi:two-component system, NarL family, response regulator DegU
MVTKIAIIDSNQHIREGIKRILEFEKAFEVVAEGNEENNILAIESTYNPDIFIFIIDKYYLNRLVIIRKLMEQNPNVKIINLSNSADSDYVTRVLQMGVMGYLLDDMAVKVLIEAVYMVARGDCYFHQKVTHNILNNYRKLLGDPKETVEHRVPLHLLTSRECDVLQLLANGQSNLRISETLIISDKTVKNHVSNILKKLNVKDRTQAFVAAI